MSQCDQILHHLQSGKSITFLQALNEYGCMHLPRRIKDLKERGVPIERVMINVPSGKRVAKYFMKKET